MTIYDVWCWVQHWVWCSSVVRITVWEPPGQGFESFLSRETGLAIRQWKPADKKHRPCPAASICWYLQVRSGVCAINIWSCSLQLQVDLKLGLTLPEDEDRRVRLAGHDTYLFVFVELRNELLLQWASFDIISQAWSFCISLVERLGHLFPSKVVSEVEAGFHMHLTR